MDRASTVRVLRVLQRMEMTLTGLAIELGLSKSTVSYCLAKLRADGRVVPVRKEGHWVYWRAAPDAKPMPQRHARYAVKDAVKPIRPRAHRHASVWAWAQGVSC